MQARATLKRLATKQRPLRLVIGASGIFDDGWIPTEISTLNILKLADWAHYFEPNTIDALLAEHVWEHLTPDEGILGARNCYHFLKPGGYLRVAVPDGLHSDPSYIDYVKPGGTGAGADDHKVLYTYRTFSNVFEQAGFKINLLEYFDDNHQFHAVDWDAGKGKIMRSLRFDSRNNDGTPHYTSLIIDAIK